jgi:hypothetical protein
MSGNEMRALMEKIDRVVLHESYEDRVQKVVDYLNRSYPDGMTKKQFTQKIEAEGDSMVSSLGVHELKRNKTAATGSSGKTGDSRKDFIKDVAASMNFRRDSSKADAKRKRQEQVLERLAWIIDEAIGNAFPDGDPWDAIYPRARKMGIPDMDMLDWLDRAVKKNLGFPQGYHEYVATIWDQHSEMLDTMPGNEPRPNPWR